MGVSFVAKYIRRSFRCERRRTRIPMETYLFILAKPIQMKLKLYCRYLYTRPCMINHIWGLKQLWLQVNGHAWFHLQRLRWPVRNGEGAKIQNENICLQRDSNPHPASPRQERCSALDRSATLFRYQVEHYSLTVFWNGYVTIPVWNRLWFDTQCKVLKTIIILAKIYNEIRNESLVWHSVQIHV